ncbi:unnamed protein product, partial [Allacma fusca]
MSRKEETDL